MHITKNLYSINEGNAQDIIVNTISLFARKLQIFNLSSRKACLYFSLVWNAWNIAQCIDLWQSLHQYKVNFLFVLTCPISLLQKSCWVKLHALHAVLGILLLESGWREWDGKCLSTYLASMLDYLAPLMGICCSHVDSMVPKIMMWQHLVTKFIIQYITAKKMILKRWITAFYTTAYYFSKMSMI